MRNFLEILFKRQKEIFVIFACTVAFVLAGVYMTTPLYESEANVLVQVGREVTLPTMVMTQPLNVYFNRSEQVMSQIEILKSQALVERTVAGLSKSLFESADEKPESVLGWLRFAAKKLLGLPGRALRWVLEVVGFISPLTREQQLVLFMQSRIDVSRVRDSEVLKVTFRHENPEFARLFLEKYLENYLQASSAASGNPEVLGFFFKQAAQVGDELAQAERKLAAFRKEWNIYDLNYQKENAARELARITTELSAARMDAAILEGKLAALKKAPAVDIEGSIPAEMRNDQGMVELLKSLVQMKVRLNQMSENLGPAHPNILALTGEVARLRDNIRREITGVLRGQLAAVKNREKELVKEQREKADLVQRLDEKGIEMEVYERKRDLLSKAYMTYAEKHETTRINTVMDKEKITSVSIIQPPTMPYKPVLPKKALSLLVAACVGVLLGFMYAFVSEAMLNTITQPEQMRQLLDAPIVIFTSDVNSLLAKSSARSPAEAVRDAACRLAGRLKKFRIRPDGAGPSGRL